MAHKCNTCNYMTDDPPNWRRHITTQKHLDRVKKENTEVNNKEKEIQLIIDNYDKMIKEKENNYNNQLLEKDKIIKEKDNYIKEKDSYIKEKDNRIYELVTKMLNSHESSNKTLSDGITKIKSTGNNTNNNTKTIINVSNPADFLNENFVGSNLILEKITPEAVDKSLLYKKVN